MTDREPRQHGAPLWRHQRVEPAGLLGMAHHLEAIGPRSFEHAEPDAAERRMKAVEVERQVWPSKASAGPPQANGQRALA
jgi:hypothetical protein